MRRIVGLESIPHPPTGNEGKKQPKGKDSRISVSCHRNPLGNATLNLSQMGIIVQKHVEGAPVQMSKTYHLQHLQLPLNLRGVAVQMFHLPVHTPVNNRCAFCLTFHMLCSILCTSTALGINVKLVESINSQYEDFEGSLFCCRNPLGNVMHNS